MTRGMTITNIRDRQVPGNDALVPRAPEKVAGSGAPSGGIPVTAPAAPARRPRWPSTLGGRLVAVLALFTALVTVVVVAAEYAQRRRLLVDETRVRLGAEAARVLDRVERDVAERQRAAATWPELDAAQDVATDDLDKRLSVALARLAGSLGAGDVALALDTAGRVVAASRAAMIGRPAREVLPWLAADPCAATSRGPLRADARGAAQLLLASPIRVRGDGRVLGCLLLTVPWEALVRAAVPPPTLDALELRDERGVVLTRGAHAAAVPRAEIVTGSARSPDGSALHLVATMAAPRDVALRPLADTRRAALLLALAMLAVTLPAAWLVAHATTRALRALTRSALAVDGLSRPVLPDPGRGAASEVRVLHAALGRMLEQQERSRRVLAEREALASLGTMAAGLAHEIRTPLAVVHGSVELLGRGAPAEERRRELVSLVTTEVARLDRLVADLLAFARPRAPARAPGDLAEVARRGALLLQTAAERQGVTIALAPHHAPATFDEEQLQQVLLNLGSNAIQASEAGATVTIATGADDAGAGTAWLEVRDAGVGIPAEALARIWTPFFTTRRQGTGLGLAIVRRIVDEHGGTIDVTSAPGAGTTVRVRLPRTMLPTSES